MLNALLSEVNQFAVAEFGQEHVLQKLRRVTRGDGLDRFEFERSAAVHQHINVLEFSESGMRNLNWSLKLHAGVTVGQFAFVDFLVEKAPELTVDLEDTSHHG